MVTFDSSGGVPAGKFARSAAEEQKSKAFTMKQQRLYREEEEEGGKRMGRQAPKAAERRKSDWRLSRQSLG
eukprot:2535493-Pyramimonas_sp.AAC.1